MSNQDGRLTAKLIHDGDYHMRGKTRENSANRISLWPELWQAGRLRIVLLHLSGDIAEIFEIIAKFRGWQTLRRAGIGLAVEPALHQQGIPAADHADQRLRQGVASAIERDEIGFAKALAGDNHLGALLQQGEIGDRRVPDNQRLGPRGNLDDAGLIDGHDQGFLHGPQGSRWAGDRHDGDQTEPIDQSGASRSEARTSRAGSLSISVHDIHRLAHPHNGTTVS